MTTQNTTLTAISIELGYINADKVKELLNTYTENENEYGYFLQVQGNKNVGVIIYTNCFKSKKAFKKYFYNLLLVNL